MTISKNMALPYYPFLDGKGKPLFNAKIYIGKANTDPKNIDNQIDVLDIAPNGSTTVLTQPIRTNSSGYAVNGAGDVVVAAPQETYSITVDNASDSLVWNEPVVDPLDNAAGVISTISKKQVSLNDGDTVINLFDLFGVKPTAITLHINDSYQQESAGAYTYSSVTGIITLAEPAFAVDKIEVIYNDIVGTSIALQAPASEVVSIRDYVTDNNNAGAGILAASQAGKIVDFAGLTLTIQDDLILPSGVKCLMWRLNGATLNFKTGTCDLGNNGYFEIDLQGGTITLGLKKAMLTANSTGGTNVFTVDSTAGWEVGDQVGCNFSQNYLPNAPSRTTILGDFNKVAALTSNTITVTYNVPEVIPANAFLTKARFDKDGIVYSGTGTFIIRNGTVKESSAGYFISVKDPTRAAKFYSYNVIYDESGLDQFQLDLHSAYFDGAYFGRCVDDSKQCIVANHAVDGIIDMRNFISRRFNRDTTFFPCLRFQEVGSFHLENFEIDGYNDRVFSGSAKDYVGDNMLHLFSYPGSEINPKVGHVTLKNGKILNVSRAVFGTTFAVQNTFAYKSFTMENIIPCQATPMNISVTDKDNSVYGKMRFTNCDIVSGLYKLIVGIPVEYSGQTVFEQCVLTQTNVSDSQNVGTIENCVLNNCEIKTGANDEGFRINDNSVVVHDLILNKKASTADRSLILSGTHSQNGQVSMTLRGVDKYFQGFLDPLDWFNADATNGDILFTFPGTNASFFYGSQTGGVSTPYTINLTSTDWNGIPDVGQGYFTMYVPEGSTVEGRGGIKGIVSDKYSTTVAADSNIGSTTVEVASATGIIPNSKIAFNDVNTPSSKTYWYNVDSLTGTTLTISPALDIDIKTGDLTRGIIVIPESAYAQAAKKGTADPIATNVMPDYIGQNYINTSLNDVYVAKSLALGSWIKLT